MFADLADTEWLDDLARLVAAFEQLEVREIAVCGLRDEFGSTQPDSVTPLADLRRARLSTTQFLARSRSAYSPARNVGRWRVPQTDSRYWRRNLMSMKS